MPKYQQKIWSLDTEGTGLDLKHGAKPFFVTMCNQDGDILYWEADVEPTTRQPKWSAQWLMEIEEQIEQADLLILQNARYDVHALWEVGIDGEWPWHKTWDTVLSAHLLCSNQPKDLTTQVLIYLRRNIKPLEDALEIAVKEARKIVHRECPDWRIAKEGEPDMPSYKGGLRKDKRGNVKEEGKGWKYDSWLPRAYVQFKWTTSQSYEVYITTDGPTFHKIEEAKKYPGWNWHPPEIDPHDVHDWWLVLSNYSNADSGSTLPLGLAHEKLLKEKKLWAIYLESLKLLPAIYEMENNGMTMSRSRLMELYDRLKIESEECRKLCIELADGEIEDLPVNGMSNALRHVLFEKFALKSNKKTDKGNASADKFVLDHWLATLPEKSRPWQFVNALRRYRKRKTALGYMDSYQKFWQYAPGELRPYTEDTPGIALDNPRFYAPDTMIVYPSFNPTGTDTLRFSSQNPNAQQVSKQEETNTRYCFGPEPGWEWWAIDFSNLELRIPAYEANEPEMVFLFEHPDDPPYYGSYHMMIFDTLHPDKFAKYGMECKKIYESTWYQWTKNGDFAVQYGAVEHSGTADQAYHVPGAQRRIMSRFTQIKKLSKRWIDFANKTGYVETMPDKTVDPTKGYPLWCTRTNYGKVLETVPLAYRVSGTAMWITRKGMVRTHNYLKKHGEGGKMICQVHDEILFAFPKGVGKRHVQTLRNLMCQAGDDIGIPLATTCTYHPVAWSLAEKN